MSAICHVKGRHCRLSHTAEPYECRPYTLSGEINMTVSDLINFARGITPLQLLEFFTALERPHALLF